MRILPKAIMVSAALLLATPAMAVEKVVWWDFLSGGDGVRMKELIQKFNAEHQGKIEIEATTLEWGTPFYTKLQTSAAIGQGPDISTYHLSRLQSGVAAKTLAPIDLKELEAIGLKDSDYPPNSIDAATVDGQRYGVPFDVHGLVLYYNKAILKDLGALGPDGKPMGIDTLEGWHAVLEKAKAAGKTAVVIEASKGDPRTGYTLFGQQGGELLTGAKFLQGDNLGKMAKAVEEMGSWVSNGWTPPYINYQTMVGAFAGGEAAFMINGAWELPTMQAEAAKGTGFDFGMMIIPGWLGKPATWVDSHAFVIPDNKGATVTPEKHAAVLEVIRWMNANSLPWAGAGHIPAYLPTRQSAEFKALTPQSDYAGFIDNAFYMPKSPLTGADSAWEQNWGGLIAGAANGEGGAQDAVEQLRDTMNGL